MSKKRYVFALVLLIILCTISYFHLKRQNFLTQRHHLLCETLKPGMSKDEILATLSQAGSFTVGDTDSPARFVELRINFTDPNGRDKYGAFELLLIDNKYVRAYVQMTSDDSELICDFYETTQSVTGTPKP